jgi:tRNA threonylcarbamoyladenosine biosynthesis protein TsaB
MILSLETATNVCAVALHKEGKLLVEKTLAMPQAHSTQLTVLIQQTLQEAGAKTQDLQAVAVSKGPGSYTGLRIGVSVGKGLCFALQIPLIAVHTLQALAYPLLAPHTPDTLFCPMLDARRMEVYCAVWDGAGKEILPTEAKIIDQDAFADLLQNHQMLYFGDGAGKCKDLIKHPNAVFLDNILPTADAIGQLAYPKLITQQTEDLAYFEPLYLKDFVNNMPKI